MTVEVRNRPIVTIDVDRGQTTFGQAQLIGFDESGEVVRGGHLPNVGDHILGVDDHNNVTKEEVTEVDFTTYQWKTKRIYDNQAPRPEQNSGSYTHLSAHVGQGFNVNELPEPGLRAKAKLAARRAARRTAKVIRWVIGSGLVLAFICAAIIVAYGYKTMETGRDSFERTCSVKLSNGLEVTAKRGYLQKYSLVLGYKFSNTRDAYEKTTLDVRNNALTVVGQYTKAKPVNPEDGSVPAPEERWWGLNIDAGDKGQMVLKGADNYTFVSGKGIAVIKYEDFCKG